MRAQWLRWTFGLAVMVVVSGCGGCGSTPGLDGGGGNGDAGPGGSDAGVALDAGEDAGVTDAGGMDAGTSDAGEMDAGMTDAGLLDAGSGPFASITDAQVNEGDFGTNELVFTVSMSTTPAVGMDAQLTWATADGTATAGSDYAASSGSLTFTNGGSLSQRITVPIIGDTVQEPNETFTVVLTAVANVGLQKAVGVGTILNDDFPALSINDVTQVAGNAGTTTAFVFTVSLTSAPEPTQDVTVQWATAPLSANAGTDYTTASGTLTFPAGGGTTQNVTIDVIGSSTVALQKEFEVVLSNPIYATLADPVGLGTILDHSGSVIHVDATATGTPDGLTWATAYPTVQAGVTRAAQLGGGQVWVAAGTYTNGGGTGPVVTLANLVSVLGGFDGWRGGAGAQETQATQRNPAMHVTTLDGATTAYHVVMGTAAGVLDGFTVTRGNANAAGTNDSDPNRRGGGLDVSIGGSTVANCTFTNNFAAGNGGAINTSAPFTAHDTVIVNNTSDNGGGLYAGALINLFDDTIQSNVADLTGAGGYGGGVQDVSQAASTYNRVVFASNKGIYGGGLHMTFGKSIVRGGVFSNNVANGSGGGFYDDSFGGSQVYDSVFSGNSATNGSGGGIESRDSNTIVSNCRLENNTAQTGGGIFNWNFFGRAAQIVNTRIAYNRATQYGGGVHNQQSLASFTNCVFEGNDAPISGGGMYNLGGSPTIVNTLMLNDTAPSGPEIQDDVLNGSPNVPSNPIAANTVIFNKTFASPAVAGTGGSLMASYSLSSDASQDPGLNHAPLFASRAGGGSTTSMLNVPNSTMFVVNDVIEVGNDGVARTVMTSAMGSLTISPALTSAPAVGTHIDDWGPAATDLDTDIRLLASSACVDTGNNSSLPPDVADLNKNGNTIEPTPLDFFLNPRVVAGFGTSAIVDIGPVERPAP